MTKKLLETKKDISNKNDIIQVINTFYAQVKIDPLLGPVFQERITTDSAWPAHLGIMYSFWNTLLFGQNDYHGNPFPKHLGLDIGSEHFDRWLGYFHQTIDLYFTGPKANEAKEKAVKMRKIFEAKLFIGMVLSRPERLLVFI